jgi:hypothetical protein
MERIRRILTNPKRIQQLHKRKIFQLVQKIDKENSNNLFFNHKGEEVAQRLFVMSFVRLFRLRG